MKRILCIILALCLTLTTFAGCGKKETPEKGDNLKDNVEDIQSDANKTDDSKVDMNCVTDASPFKNGIAYVEYGANETVEEQEILFINKQGNVLFKSKDYFVMNGEPIFTPNGVTILREKKGNNYVLCDIKANKIYSASDLGGTDIVRDRFNDAFEDGYMLVEKIETTFDGSTKTLAIYNGKFELLCPFSEEMYDFALGTGYSYYNNGYILNDSYPNQYIDIKNGVIGEDITKIPLSSDLNAWDKLEGKFDTLAYRTEFSNNCAGVVFESEGVYYYSIIDIDGNLAFEPIQAEYSEGTLNGEKREYVLGNLDKQNNNFHIEMFDMNGRTGTIDVPVQYTGRVYDRYLCLYGDETVVVEIYGKETTDICYYNMDGTRLF